MIWHLILSSVLVTVCVAIHYECLQFVAIRILPRLHLRPARLLVIIGVLTCMAAHVAEIWFFAAIYYGLYRLGLEFGYDHSRSEGFIDFLSRSAESYTSLGFANAAALTPPQRLLLGSEALAGLVMIAWTASFTFLLMERYWRQHREL